MINDNIDTKSPISFQFCITMLEAQVHLSAWSYRDLLRISVNGEPTQR